MTHCPECGKNLALVGARHNCKSVNTVNNNDDLDDRRPRPGTRRQQNDDTSTKRVVELDELIAGKIAPLTKRVADLELLVAKLAPAMIQTMPPATIQAGETKEERRKRQLREAQRKRREKAKRAK